MSEYFVYILTNNTQVLYIGVTNNLDDRLHEHTRDRNPGSFAARYNLDRLVYYEVFPTPIDAIAREKQLKGWSREKKKKLIRGMNPMWKDLVAGGKAAADQLAGRFVAARSGELILRQAQDDGTELGIGHPERSRRISSAPHEERRGRGN